MFLLFLVFVLCFQISACGFSPLYGTASQSMNAAAEAELNRIAIAIIPDRDGQYLRNALIGPFLPKRHACGSDLSIECCAN